MYEGEMMTININAIWNEEDNINMILMNNINEWWN